MPNLGEEMCGEYLNHIKECEFISYNIINPDIQGEIDVVGINLETREIYICEVAIHTSGLQYVTNKRPDDFNRFAAKFDKDVAYAKKYFSDYHIKPMLWSPIVRISGPAAKYNTYKELQRLVSYIQKKYNLTLELVINENFLRVIDELKNYAKSESSEFKSSVMRMFQIEGTLDKHLKNLTKRKV